MLEYSSKEDAYKILCFQENRKTQVPLVKKGPSRSKTCDIKTEDIGNRNIQKKNCGSEGYDGKETNEEKYSQKRNEHGQARE